MEINLKLQVSLKFATKQAGIITLLMTADAHSRTGITGREGERELERGSGREVGPDRRRGTLLVVVMRLLVSLVVVVVV